MTWYAIVIVLTWNFVVLQVYCNFLLSKFLPLLFFASWSFSLFIMALSERSFKFCLQRCLWGLARYSEHSTATSLQKLLHHFCICWTPTLRLKMTATDPAFRWCWLLVLVLWFSQRKCGVCPKKVGKVTFSGCSEFHWTKLPWRLLLDLKRYLSKVRVFWNAWAIGFQMVKFKNLSCTTIIMHGGTLLKSVSAVGFSEIPSFWESVSFQREMFCGNHFWLVLRICIVNAMNFIKKNIDKLVQDQFLQPVKGHPCDKFGYVDKIMP